MEEPIIRAKDLAYVRVQAPDLALGEKFLTDFGLSISARSDNTLYARGTDSPHHIYILHKGPLAFRAVAFHAHSMDDLQKLTQANGASPIEKLDEPGGGYVVRLTDPNGHTVEVIHGMEQLEPLDPGPALPLNVDGHRNRVGVHPQVKPGPSTVKRIGHMVIETPDIETSYHWYHKHIGLLRTDLVVRGNDPVFQFARLDKGSDYTDHHTVGFQGSLEDTTRLQHVSFEVKNIDDVMVGHNYLTKQKYKHLWGIGRHRLGGQVYDYWRDPWGRIHEHWADSDVFNADYEPQTVGPDEAEDYWGANLEPPMGYLVQKWNWAAVKNVAGVAWGMLRTKNPSH